MVVWRGVGVLLLILALGGLVHGLLQGEFITLGELWFRLNRFSLNLAQAVIERYIVSALWDFVLAPLLRVPFAGVAGVLGVILFWSARRRRRGNAHSPTRQGRGGK